MIVKKAGEKMPLDEIKTIAEAEQLAAAQRSEAAVRAKQIRSDALGKGQASYEAGLAAAHSKGEMIIADSVRTDGGDFGEIAQQQKQQEENLRAAAAAKMEQAVHIIVEGIVND